MFFRLFLKKDNVALILFVLLLNLSAVNTSFSEENTFLTLEKVEKEGSPILSLEAAGKIALQRDYIIKSYMSISDALQDESVALNTLPDPKLKLGLLNIPTDTYDFDQENMTQKKIGFIQMFPKGDSLEIKSQRAIINSDRNVIKANERKRKVLDLTRKAWLEVYYWVNAKKILDENRILFNDLVEITEGQYAAGKRRQVDYVQAQIELDLLNDKDYMFSEKTEIARAELATWVGDENALKSVGSKLTELHEDIELLKDSENNKKHIDNKLFQHPMVLLSKNKIKFNKKNVELAQQDYKPSWSIDLSYAFREDKPTGIDRANFLSAMVLVDIPLFTGNRQDRRVSSKLKKVSASKNNLDDMLKIMNTKLEKSHKRLVWLKKRIAHYNKTLFPRAEENSQAALLAYQSDRSDFLSLIKARIIEFNTQLQFLRLNVDHVSTEATLSYLLGDE
ncbi:MAG: TolC family protein [Gammaproteobacteria bacterium]